MPAWEGASVAVRRWHATAHAQKPLQVPYWQGGYWRTFDSTMGLLLPKLERQHNARAAQGAAPAFVQPAVRPVNPQNAVTWYRCNSLYLRGMQSVCGSRTANFTKE